MLKQSVKKASLMLLPVLTLSLTGGLATVQAKQTVNLFNSKSSFVETMRPYAKAVGAKYHLDPNALISLAALETGWGHKIMQSAGVNSYNLFSIKKSSDWNGDTVKVLTTECSGSTSKSCFHTHATFKAYDSYQQSFDDFANLLKTRHRYQPVVEQQTVDQTNVAGFAKALQKSGYATDPSYAKKVEVTYNQVVAA